MQTIQSATCSERRSTVAVCLTKAWHSFFAWVTTYHYSCNTTTQLSLSFSRNCLLLPTLQSKHKTLSRVIVTQCPKYCSVLSPRQINHEKTASVCFLITSSYPHKHSVTLWTVSSLKEDRIYPLHQIEMFRLKYCQDINSGICAKPGIQIRCCIGCCIQRLYPPSERGCKDSWKNKARYACHGPITPSRSISVSDKSDIAKYAQPHVSI